MVGILFISSVEIDILLIDVGILVRLSHFDRLVHVVSDMRRPCTSAHLLLDTELSVHIVSRDSVSSVEIHAVTILRRSVTSRSLREHSHRSPILRCVLRTSSSRAFGVVGLPIVVATAAHVSVASHFLRASRLIGCETRLVVSEALWLVTAL